MRLISTLSLAEPVRPLPGRGRGHSRGFVAADLDRARNGGRPDPRTPIMRRLRADRGDNPDPGTLGHANEVDA